MNTYYVWDENNGEEDSDPKTTGKRIEARDPECAVESIARLEPEIGPGDHLFYCWHEKEDSIVEVNLTIELELSYFAMQA